MRIIVQKLALVSATAALLGCVSISVMAQTGASAPAVTAQATAPQSASDAKAAKAEAKAEKKKAKAEAKAQRKAARKEAHAKNGAELKRLKDAGYDPQSNAVSYPENIQQAEKKADAAQKAAASTGASQ